MTRYSSWWLIVLIGLQLSSLAQPGQISIARIEAMPSLPQPLAIRDWKDVAIEYDNLIFSTNHQGQYLPLLSFAPAGAFNYPQNEAILLDTYVGSKDHLNQAEAINIMPAIIGATLVGIDKSNQNGINYVAKLKDFFNLKNGQLLYLNNYFGITGDDWWYEVIPNLFFLQLKKLYPNCYPEAAQHMSIITRQWNDCVISLGGKETPWTVPNMNYRAFNFKTMEPLTTGVPEPEAAGAIAWILFYNYEKTGNHTYRIAAEQAMEFLDGLQSNPSYELQLAYGVAAAARMNAILGTNYNLEKLTGWCFDKGPLRGWGSIRGNWGGFDVSGLIGEVEESTDMGYAFSMNGFQQAGALAPLPKYDKRFARILGKWLLNVTNASHLFYPNALPPEQQDNYSWASNYDTLAVIPYEALKAPWQGWPIFARGDAMAGGWANTNLSLYSGSSVGYLAAIVHPTHTDAVLKIDMNATDWFADNDLPAYLLYNPYPDSVNIKIEVPAGYNTSYESITETHHSVADTLELFIPSDQARIVRFYHSVDSLHQSGNWLMAGDFVLDYNYGYNYNKSLRIKSLGVLSKTILKGQNFQVWCNADNLKGNPIYKWYWNNDSTISAESTHQFTAPNDTGNYILRCQVIDGDEKVSDTIHLKIKDFIPQIPVIDSIKPDKVWYQASENGNIRLWADDNHYWVKWHSGTLPIVDDTGYVCRLKMPERDTAFWLKVDVSNSYGLCISDSVAILVKDTTQPAPDPLIWLPFDNSDSNMAVNKFHPQTFEIARTSDPRGLPEKAIYFPASESYIIFPFDNELNFQEPITVCAWINPKAPALEQYIVSQGSWEERFKISWIPNQKIRFTINTTRGIADLDTRNTIAQNKYTHVTAVYSGYSMEVYLDGIINTFIPLSGSLNETQKLLLLGRMLENVQEYRFTGSLDEFRLYNGLLQPNHVKSLMNTWMNESASSVGLKIFPVPCKSNDILWIEAGESITKVELFNITGSMLQKTEYLFPALKTKISTPPRTGIYIVRVTLSNGKMISGKILVY